MNIQQIEQLIKYDDILSQIYYKEVQIDEWVQKLLKQYNAEQIYQIIEKLKNIKNITEKIIQYPEQKKIQQLISTFKQSKELIKTSKEQQINRQFLQSMKIKFKRNVQKYNILKEKHSKLKEINQTIKFCQNGLILKNYIQKLKQHLKAKQKDKQQISILLKQINKVCRDNQLIKTELFEKEKQFLKNIRDLLHTQVIKQQQSNIKCNDTKMTEKSLMILYNIDTLIQYLRNMANNLLKQINSRLKKIMIQLKPNIVENYQTLLEYSTEKLEGIIFIEILLNKSPFRQYLVKNEFENIFARVWYKLIEIYNSNFSKLISKKQNETFFLKYYNDFYTLTRFFIQHFQSLIEQKKYIQIQISEIRRLMLCFQQISAKYQVYFRELSISVCGNMNKVQQYLKNFNNQNIDQYILRTNFQICKEVTSKIANGQKLLIKVIKSIKFENSSKLIII